MSGRKDELREPSAPSGDLSHICGPQRGLGDPERTQPPPPGVWLLSICYAWAQIPGVELRELSEASVKMPEAEAPSERVPGAPVRAESRAARASPCAVGAETAVARGRVRGLGVQVAGKPRASQSRVPRSAEL